MFHAVGLPEKDNLLRVDPIYITLPLEQSNKQTILEHSSESRDVLFWLRTITHSGFKNLSTTSKKLDILKLL